MASMYAVYHGPEGLKKIALRVHRQASILALALKQLGLEVVNTHWFDTLTIKTPNAKKIHEAAQKLSCNLRAIDSEHVGVSIDETTGRKELQMLWTIFGGQGELNIDAIDQSVSSSVPSSLIRNSEDLTCLLYTSPSPRD